MRQFTEFKYKCKKCGKKTFVHLFYVYCKNCTLEHFREEIRKECISYGELVELKALSRYIHPSDVELREWAGMKEN